jgi:hydroxyacylglutathione hydrolase
MAVEEVMETYMCEDFEPLGLDIHQELLKRSSPCSHHPLSELIIGHSHSHDDHIAGDAELKNFKSSYVRRTTFIPPHNTTALKVAYAIHEWPQSQGRLDLGNRILDIIPIPGHQNESIAVYDRQTGLLLTGDSVYPGRLFIPKDDFETFKMSHSRLEEWAKGREISWVLGCHIEQKKRPFEEYPKGTIWQPEEHVLQLDVGVLRKVGLALQSIDGESKGQKMFAEFSIVLK